MPGNKKVDSVAVRMYRHGFGDCFLLLFFSCSQPVYSMLIDCGIKWNTKSEAVPISDVIADLTNSLPKGADDKPKLDVLVVTHEHWDHIAFFHPTRGGNSFGNFDIEQIWLAWTDNPEDDEAVQINSRLRDATVALGLAAEKLSEDLLTESAEADGEKMQLALRQKFAEGVGEVLGFMENYRPGKNPKAASGIARMEE